MNSLPKNISVACNPIRHKNQSRHKNQRSDRNHSRCRFTLSQAAGGIQRSWLGWRFSFFSARMSVSATSMRPFVPSYYTPLRQRFKMRSRRRPYACRCSRIPCDVPFSTCDALFLTCDGQSQAIAVVSHCDTPLSQPNRKFIAGITPGRRTFCDEGATATCDGAKPRKRVCVFAGVAIAVAVYPWVGVS
jgi:hypothetical protein